MGGSQNYGPFLNPYYNTAPNILGYPKRDQNFDNPPNGLLHSALQRLAVAARSSRFYREVQAAPTAGFRIPGISISQLKPKS